MLSFRLHVVAWQPDNGKYVRLKSRVRLNIRVQGVSGGSSAEARAAELANVRSKEALRRSESRKGIAILFR